MAPMQQRRCLVGSQPLGQKPERAIRDHVQGVDHPYALILPDGSAQPEQQDDIKQDLQLTGGPADGHTRYELACAAAAENAVEAGAQQCEDHADGEYVEYLRRFSPGQLRAQVVEQGEEEYRAEQAHTPRLAHVEPHLDNGKDLHAQHAANRMQHRQQQRSGPLDMQPLLAEQQPDKGKGCAHSKQKQQRYFVIQIHHQPFMRPTTPFLTAPAARVRVRQRQLCMAGYPSSQRRPPQ